MNNIALAASAAGELPNWFAVTMGIGTVFVGLISIILICLVTGAICGSNKKPRKGDVINAIPPKRHTDDREIIAAVCAACAEDMGTDVESLRVISFKKL